MPGNIHDRHPYATNPHADHSHQLQAQINHLTQQVAHLTGMLQQQAARPNPAAPPPPQGGISDQILIQLLLSERERGDRATERLIQMNDPVSQIESLSALVDLLPTAEDTSQKDMLNGALLGLGQVMVERMGSEEAGGGDAAPPEHHAADAPGVPGESDLPFAVAFDPGPEPGPTPPGDLGMGEG
jgi:hypothetical protein